MKALANEDTLLRTHCCRHKCFPVCPSATFVVDTNFVSGTQKMFLILFRNILCPQQMFPSLRSPRNIMSNNTEVKHDVYGKRQTAKMNVLSTLFSWVNSKVKLFVFAMNSMGRYSIFVCFIYGLEDSKSEVIFAVCRLPLTSCLCVLVCQYLDTGWILRACTRSA